MAAVQTHAIVQGILPLRCPLVAGVGDPAVGLEEHSGAEVLFAVPPVRWAGSAAACAEDALVETVELCALVARLEVLFALQRKLVWVIIA